MAVMRMMIKLMVGQYEYLAAWRSEKKSRRYTWGVRNLELHVKVHFVGKSSFRVRTNLHTGFLHGRKTYSVFPINEALFGV